MPPTKAACLILVSLADGVFANDIPRVKRDFGEYRDRVLNHLSVTWWMEPETSRINTFGLVSRLDRCAP